MNIFVFLKQKNIKYFFVNSRKKYDEDMQIYNIFLFS